MPVKVLVDLLTFAGHDPGTNEKVLPPIDKTDSFPKSYSYKQICLGFVLDDSKIREGLKPRHTCTRQQLHAGQVRARSKCCQPRA